MRKGRIILLAILLAVILAVELYLFTRCTRGDIPLPEGLSQSLEQARSTAAVSETMPPAPVITAPPVSYTSPPIPTAPPATQPPQASAPPADTATPMPTPSATPMPSAPPTEAPPTPAPVTPPPGTTVSSGSASSSTGTNLNMSISWQAVDMGGGTTRVTVSGSVTSYSLQVISEPVTVSVAGYSTTVMGSAVNVPDGTTSLTSTSLFSTTIDVPSGTVGDLTATWNFQGSYSGVSLPTVTASGYMG